MPTTVMAGPHSCGATSAHQSAQRSCGPTTKGGHTQPTQGTPLEHLALVARGIAPWGSTWHILYKATILRPGNVAELPNT